MSRRVAAGLVLALATGCAAGGKLRADAEVARADIAKARASGALQCAPRDLALAEANVEFAERETATGHGARAREHLDASEASVKRALELSRGCGPTQVTIAKRDEKPAVRIEKTDTDKDGVPDVDDRCPELPGRPETGGCPDADGDGVLDADDACPAQPGPKASQGCPVAKDSDSDGVPDDIDRCPLDPEDRDGFQDEDGCPDADNDGDGIVDKADACPLEPGPIEARGCPVKDRDGDGVTDPADACPDVAGLKVLAGCPDSDSDGIADAEDKCPQKAGTKENGGCPDADADGDGLADRLDKCPAQFGPPPDGCPKKYTLVEVRREKIDIKQQVHFATAKFRVLPDSFPLLNQVVQVLRDFSKMRISIEGHTDAVGTEAANMRLSQRRAEAVLDYLISKGISPERIEAVGYGPTKPIASNKTVTGRARNRRTEFRIVALE
ncbi:MULTISPECIES: OmpA family protein [Anaeromyxobacter]|uniref:OmpA family protein n=1 Tax=Anaeromyxobacter TaxID=161492 RepID=UPI001F587B7C|nr:MULTISPECIES: OmpA family protein [unclassified Anaeromyxobacter]